MRALLSTLATLLLVAEAGTGCGGGESGSGTGTSDGVFTTLEVTPATRQPLYGGAGEHSYPLGGGKGSGWQGDERRGTHFLQR